MKKLIIILLVPWLLMSMVSILPTPAKAQQFQVTVSFQTFYDQLSPYGSWLNYPGYGYVWRPGFYSGFRPYSSNGHWVWSPDYEWIWISDYDWGWAPFHYGRWFYDAFYGWLWVPGYEWSPAWVVWRSGGDYYGWAPLSPGYDMDYSFEFYAPPMDYWIFILRRYIISPYLYKHCYHQRYNRRYHALTGNMNNYYTRNERGRNIFVNGPPRKEVERYAKVVVRPVNIREQRRPGRTVVSNNNVNIYRPVVNVEPNRQNIRPVKFKQVENTAPLLTKPDDQYKNQPIRVEPRPEPVIEPPVKFEPVKEPPVKHEPVQQPPVKFEPVKEPPVKHEPVQQPPVKFEPVKEPPVKHEPVQQPPVKFEPVKVPPVKHEPVQQPPVKFEPVQQPPVKHEPVKQPPVRYEPVQQPPVKFEPVQQPPVKYEPVQKPPVRREPVQVQPVNPPVKKEPIKNLPKKNGN